MCDVLPVYMIVIIEAFMSDKFKVIFGVKSGD